MDLKVIILNFKFIYNCFFEIEILKVFLPNIITKKVERYQQTSRT